MHKVISFSKAKGKSFSLKVFGFTVFKSKKTEIVHQLSFFGIKFNIVNYIKLSEVQSNTLEKIEQQLRLMSQLEKRLSNLADEVGLFKRESIGLIKEITWANVFNTAIAGDSLLKDQSFYVGRWAAGYNCLYVIYRIMREKQPKNILEFGLGQSTKLISLYAREYNFSHTVIENNKEWVDFYSLRNHLSKMTNIHISTTKIVEYEKALVRVYDKLPEDLSKIKYDFIFIDAPFGGDMVKYSRVDIIKYLPNILGDDFVIVFDDTNRIPEKNTAKKIMETLRGLPKIIWDRNVRSLYIFAHEPQSFHQHI